MDPTIEFFLKLLFNLVLATPGATALVVVLVNIGKVIGWVKDNNAEVAINVLNVVMAIVIGCLALFLPNLNIPGLDATFGSLAATLTAFLPLLAILVKWLAPTVYGAFRGVPLVGHSHTLNPKK